MEVPPPRERVEAEMPDGARLVLRRHGNPAGERIVLSHGNGLATDAYFPFWSRLCEQFDLVVYDQRNHGWNPYCGSPGHHLEGFAADLDRVLDVIEEQFGAKPTSGAFHSVSAIASLLHATTAGWRWKKLVLFDPPVVPTPGEALHEIARDSELFLARWAMQRAHIFDHPAELTAILADTRAMRGLVNGAHDLMARALLRPSGAGWTLSCPRELEASIYIANGYSLLWDQLGALGSDPARILLVSADPTPENARYPALVALRMRERITIAVTPIEGTTHMLQIEKPAACAEVLRNFLSAARPDCG